MFGFLYEYGYIPLSLVVVFVICPFSLMRISKLLNGFYSADNLSSPRQSVHMPQSRIDKWFGHRRVEVYLNWCVAALLLANAIRATLLLVNGHAPLNLPTAVINTLSIISFCLLTAWIEARYNINESVKAINEALESKRHAEETQCSQSK